ncbi:YciI family protein [Formosa sp. S-31]|uniref:YciI family protein n=1 Tax=Formosa sp. S-31 TaxID=2790949 RepID=UPI003EB8AAD1
MKYLVSLLMVLSVLSCKNDKTENGLNLPVRPIDTLEVVSEIDTLVILEEVLEAPKTHKEIKAELEAKGFETFDYIDEKTQDTVLMQKYFIAFLKSGAIRTQNEEEAQKLQQAHLAHLGKMYELGYADISGPFGDDGDIRGITIYNVPTLKMADSLANADPMVKAGRLEIEIHPWWAAKGFMLR